MTANISLKPDHYLLTGFS